MFALTYKAWSPYAAGILIGLLQIPAFLLIHTALGASLAYVTIVGHLAGVIDPGLAPIEYVVKHPVGAKNWWVDRSEVGRGGRECGRAWSSTWAPEHRKKRIHRSKG